MYTIVTANNYNDKIGMEFCSSLFRRYIFPFSEDT